MRQLRIDSYVEQADGSISVSYTENADGVVPQLPSGNGFSYPSWADFKARMDQAEKAPFSEDVVFLALAKVYRGDASRNQMTNANGATVTLDYSGNPPPVKVV